jgi:hypothetical protein
MNTSMSEFDKEVERIDAGGNAWDDTEEVVDIEVKQPLGKSVSVKLTDAEFRLLLKEARSLGVGHNTLAQKWVLERLATMTKAKSA